MASVDRDSSRKRTPWVVRWRDDAGKQRKRGFARKLDADRYRAEVEHSLNVGSYVDPVGGRITFREYAEQWRAIKPHRFNTAERIRYQLTRHVYPVIGARPLAQLRTSEIQALITGLPLAPSSARTIAATLKAILRAAVRDRLIGHSPADGVELPEMPRRKVVPLTLAQLDALATALPERYRALVVVGAGTGLRQGELFGLQVRDIDFLRRTLTVERQVQAGTGDVVTAGPLKTKQSYRTVPLGRVVVEALAAHLQAYPASGSDFVFTNDAGKPLHRNRFGQQVWGPARTAAGLPGTGMHELRHYFASLLIGAGLSVKVVAERLGHANAAMTLNTYAHLFPTDEDRTRDAVDAAFRPDVPTMRPRKGSTA